jgi:hypothetical protein
LLAVVHVNPAEHLTATNAPEVFATGVVYDCVHRCGRCCTAGTLYDWHPADFDFVHFFFPAYVLYVRIFPLLTEGGDGAT